ncbi:MAG: hypothetical protein WC683_06315 [bacterium]
MNALILHHNDWDGFAAGWIARRALVGHDVASLPVDYGTAFPFEADSIVVIDHHKTAIAALEAWIERPRNVFLELDIIRAIQSTHSSSTLRTGICGSSNCRKARP